jgi:hypothetical protein
MKKTKVSLFRGEVETSEQHPVLQAVITIIAAGFLLALAYILKDGFLILLIRKIAIMGKIRGLLTR